MVFQYLHLRNAQIPTLVGSGVASLCGLEKMDLSKNSFESADFIEEEAGYSLSAMQSLLITYCNVSLFIS